MPSELLYIITWYSSTCPNWGDLQSQGSMQISMLRFYMKKTKFLVSCIGSSTLMLSVIHVVVSATTPSSAHCASSGFTRHSAIIKLLMADTNYICLVRDGNVRPIDGRSVTEVDIDGTMLDVEATFCYLGDMLCCRGGSDSIVVACCCLT